MLSFVAAALCADLAFEAHNGPLSHHTGSWGTCSRETGECVVYWKENDVCDTTEVPAVPVDIQPRLTYKEVIQREAEYCRKGMTRFGPAAPCDTVLSYEF